MLVIDKLYLYNTVDVASVPEVVEASECGSTQGSEFTAGLLQRVPLSAALVQLQLQLDH